MGYHGFLFTLLKQCVYGMFGICISNFACSCGISSLILCLLCYLLCGYNYIGYAQAQSQSSVSWRDSYFVCSPNVLREYVVDLAYQPPSYVMYNTE